MIAVIAAAFVLALVLWLWCERPRPPLAPVARALRDALDDWAVAALAALAVAVHLYLLLVSLTFPQSLPDTLTYHLPRAALWKQQHAVAYVLDVPDNRIDAFPPVAEIETTASMVLSDGDLYVGLVQLIALAGASGAIVGIARRLGLSRRAALFGALAFATFTVVALQAPTALNDLVVASLLVVCAYFALGSSRVELGLAATALALGLGAKGMVIYALPVLAAFVLASQPRSRWWSLAGAAAAGLAAGSFWFVLTSSRPVIHAGASRSIGASILCSSGSGCPSSISSSCRMRRGQAFSPRRSGGSACWSSHRSWEPCSPSADTAARVGSHLSSACSHSSPLR